jgi:molybdate transport system ATP-binding protein
MPSDRALTVDVRATTPDRGFAIDVTFEAPAGLTILFGPSGAGKSTTLAAIAGLIRPHDGRIALGDQAWFDARTSEEMPVERRRVALLSQAPALFPHLTVLENVEFGIARSRSRDDRRSYARAMLERMTVAHLEQRRPPSLSGGEARRVALARAFAMAPAVILLDEPFGAMDVALRSTLAGELRGFIEETRLPAILVTHDPEEARLGDRIVHLRGGRVVKSE